MLITVLGCIRGWMSMNLQKTWAAFNHLSEMKSTVFSGHSLTPDSEHHCFKNEQLKPLCPLPAAVPTGWSPLLLGSGVRWAQSWTGAGPGQCRGCPRGGGVGELSLNQDCPGSKHQAGRLEMQHVPRIAATPGSKPKKRIIFIAKNLLNYTEGH